MKSRRARGSLSLWDVWAGCITDDCNDKVGAFGALMTLARQPPAVDAASAGERAVVNRVHPSAQLTPLMRVLRTAARLVPAIGLPYADSARFISLRRAFALWQAEGVDLDVHNARGETAFVWANVPGADWWYPRVGAAMNPVSTPDLTYPRACARPRETPINAATRGARTQHVRVLFCGDSASPSPTLTAHECLVPVAYSPHTEPRIINAHARWSAYALTICSLLLRDRLARWRVALGVLQHSLRHPDLEVCTPSVSYYTDVIVIHPCNQTHMRDAAIHYPMPLEDAENTKANKHNQYAKLQGTVFWPFACETHGALGPATGYYFELIKQCAKDHNPQDLNAVGTPRCVRVTKSLWRLQRGVAMAVKDLQCISSQNPPYIRTGARAPRTR